MTEEQLVGMCSTPLSSIGGKEGQGNGRREGETEERGDRGRREGGREREGGGREGRERGTMRQ